MIGLLSRRWLEVVDESRILSCLYSDVGESRSIYDKRLPTTWKNGKRIKESMMRYLCNAMKMLYLAGRLEVVGQRPDYLATTGAAFPSFFGLPGVTAKAIPLCSRTKTTQKGLTPMSFPCRKAYVRYRSEDSKLMGIRQLSRWLFATVEQVRQANDSFWFIPHASSDDCAKRAIQDSFFFDE